jgi:cytochrome c-type biogenesis protein CcmF
MAALITGHLDDSWLRAVRRWTMIAWLFLSIGLGLGMIWAYEELGWGGYWMWDPVENAGLLPWFTATAFLHSVMVQERRGMLRVWNVSLVIIDVLPDAVRHVHDAVRHRAVRALVRTGSGI